MEFFVEVPYNLYPWGSASLLVRKRPIFYATMGYTWKAPGTQEILSQTFDQGAPKCTFAVTAELLRPMKEASIFFLDTLKFCAILLTVRSGIHSEDMHHVRMHLSWLSGLFLDF